MILDTDEVDMDAAADQLAQLHWSRTAADFRTIGANVRAWADLPGHKREQLRGYAREALDEALGILEDHAPHPPAPAPGSGL